MVASVTFRNLRVHWLASCLAAAISSPAFAQLAPPPPVRQSIDTNGVDLFLGTYNVNGPAITIGSFEPQGMSYYKINHGSGWSDNLIAALDISGSTYVVTFNGRSDAFTLSGSTYVPTETNGASLTFDGTSVYTYVGRDGTVAHFDKTRLGSYPWYASGGRVTDILQPNGQKLTFNYESQLYCSGSKPGGAGDICTTHNTAYRIATVRNSYGYQAALSYQTSDIPDPDDINPDLTGWSTVNGVTLSNLAAPAGSATVTGNGFTDGMGRLTTFRLSGARVAGVTLPGSGGEDITVAYGTDGRVSSITTPSGVTSYGSSDSSSVRTVTVTDPLNHVTTYTFDIASQRMTGVTDAAGKTTTLDYDGSGRLLKVTKPEGNYAQMTYDERGNVTQTLMVAKPGSGLANISLTAGYDTSCTNPVKCNEPNWTKDGKGNQTDYTYDVSHGGVLTVTSPAPTTGAVRPQTRYTYSSLQAYFRDNSGAIVASGEPVYRVTTIAQCQANATCNGTADEVRTTIDFGPQTAGIGNNLLPVGTTRSNGTGSLSATSAFAYDAMGNLTSVDGPLSGSADTIAYVYNAAREQIGVMSPDPDGAGALKNRAQKITIDSRSLPTRLEVGTTAGQTTTAWNGFAAAQIVDVTYDSSRRPVTRKLSAGATAYALSQTSYLADDRIQCVAQRMNPAVYGSLPASACTVSTQGSDGPDQIRMATYDNNGRITQIDAGVGTAAAKTVQTFTYSDNGLATSLTDGANNKTTYVYDGFDRPSQTQHPSSTQGAGTSNSADYEQATYDANGNATSLRLRDGTSIALTYDNLDRVTLKNLPGTEPDVSYTYDNLGRLTSATQTGNALSFTYDALGRNLTQVGPQGTATSVWDTGGRRTSLAYPGGSMTVTYNYLVTGEVSQVLANGFNQATWSYDDLGNQTNVAFANGVSQAATFDPVSRLASLTNNMSGTSNDLSASFTYNPASQLKSVTHSPDAYAFTGLAAVNRDYTTNGRNQYVNTKIGGATISTFSYDGHGNLTGDGSNTFGYSSENLLTGASVGGTASSLAYDPLTRLAQLTAGASTTKFAYDGLNMIVEYNASNSVLRRHIFAPGMDRPILSYEGSGTGNSARVFYSTDERGSIISLSDYQGNKIAINTYDEYGIPGSGNMGRFQYTGQAYLSEIGLYYYKARMYSPILGKFLQADPIGQEDNANLYAYVGADPVNATDPLGLKVPVAPATGSMIPGVMPIGPFSCSGDCSGYSQPGNSGQAQGNSLGGYWECTNCGQPSKMVNGEIVVTAAQYVWRSYGWNFGGWNFGGIMSSWAEGGDSPQSGQKESKWDKFKDCAAAQYGFGDGDTPTGLDFGKMVSEVGALPIPKALVGVPVIGNSSRFTNAVSYIPFKLGIRMNTGMQILGSGRVFGVLGRANAIVGGAMLAWDAASIAICTARDK